VDGLLERVLGRLAPSSVPAGQLLLRQGERHDRIFRVERGTVWLVAVSERGRACILDVVRTGEVFGEWSLGTDRPAPFGAAAAVETTLRSIAAGELRMSLRDDAAAYAELLAVASDRSLRLAGLLGDSLVLDARNRILARLEDLCDRYGVPVAEGTLLPLPLTQDGIAAMCGCTRETVNRWIAALLATGRIRVRRRRFVLPPRDP
jgi:CRP-like cAMP-binding protein